MTPDSWETVKSLFEQGCEVDAADRAALLATPNVSPEIRAEVERLLRLHDSAGEAFLGQPPKEIATLRRSQLGRLGPGELLASRYVVTRFLGSGGMGEVDTQSTQDSILRPAEAFPERIPRNPASATKTPPEVHGLVRAAASQRPAV